jgi:hypothetical protein
LEGVEKVVMKEEGVFVVRYADDITVLATTREQVLNAKTRMEVFLKERGLRFNEDKTEIREISEGFELLGYHVKDYPNITKTKLKGKPGKKGIVIVKPSKKSIAKFVKTLKETARSCADKTPGQLIMKLNPIIRG